MRFTRSRVPKEAAELQERVDSAFKDLESNPLYGALLIEDTALTGGATTNVAHKLGRKVRGFLVCKAPNTSDVTWNTASTADLTRFLPLYTALTQTISIVVF